MRGDKPSLPHMSLWRAQGHLLPMSIVQ